MTAFGLDVIDWIGSTQDAEAATLGSVSIRAGEVPLSEVHDALARTTRQTIRVSAIRIAEWLAANYWRHRWEPRPRRPTGSWRHAHSMAALGGGFAWPDLEISGDGDIVELVMTGEDVADAAAIRYLRHARLEVAGSEFDASVRSFLALVDARVNATVPSDTTLRELRAELDAELADPEVARWCRLEARAGIDPGEAPDGWRSRVTKIESEAGRASTEDMLAAGGIDAVTASIAAMKSSTVEIDLPGPEAAPAVVGRPWERGAQLARWMRGELGVESGPVSDERLSELLGVKFSVVPQSAADTPILGAYRAPDQTARALVPKKRRTGQRFYLARLVGAAIHLPRSERVLPVTDARTSTQKLVRSFAQELLCPWEELDAWTDEHGTGEESLARAAERYDVSELLVATTLVNRGKLGREHLDSFG